MKASKLKIKQKTSEKHLVLWHVLAIILSIIKFIFMIQKMVRKQWVNIIDHMLTSKQTHTHTQMLQSSLDIHRQKKNVVKLNCSINSSTRHKEQGKYLKWFYFDWLTAILKSHTTHSRLNWERWKKSLQYYAGRHELLMNNHPFECH